jgi:hypothetical protein
VRDPTTDSTIMDRLDTSRDLTLYAVSAQVLPTLVIALALGLPDLRVNVTWTMTLIAIEMCAALVATVACVFVLANGKEPSGRIEDFVTITVLAMGAALVGLILRWFTHPDPRHAGRVSLDPPPSLPPASLQQTKRLPSVALILIAVLAFLLGRGRRRLDGALRKRSWRSPLARRQQ